LRWFQKLKGVVLERETAGKPVYALGDRFATACLMTAIGGFLDAYTCFVAGALVSVSPAGG
jgi:hypothetical protein